MKKYAYLIVVILPLQYLVAQDSGAQPGVKLNGFIKSDFFFDSHESVSIREGHFLLYPSRDVLDANDEVINDNPSFNFLSIQSRLTAKISGPDAFGAKISGVIEADFFGNENKNFSDLNGFRMRHAFVKMNWSKTEVIAGQYWHPMFIVNCFPDVISFNTGAPFQPFSRNPQIRLTRSMGKWSAVAALNSQRDFTSIGGSSELRNAGIPEMNLQIHYGGKKMTTGIGLEHKVLAPRISNTVGNNTYVMNERVGSSAILGYTKYQSNGFSVKLHAVYGQNLSDLVMLGGYAPSSVLDTITGEMEYTTLNNLALWGELIRSFQRFDLGIFGGYSQNLGATEAILLSQLSTKTRGSDIHSVYRISPRLVFKSGKLRIALESEYTAAAYSRPDMSTPAINEKGVVTDYKYVGNLRGLLAFIYAF